MARERSLRGAHACSVLVSAFCRNELPSACNYVWLWRRKKFAMVWRPSPARCKRALPGHSRHGAFTPIELLIVMAIIIVLAGLILATSGYVQKKGARSRAEAEIAAMSAALESYKADNGIYPSDSFTDALNPTATTGYDPASALLYKELAGDRDGDRTADAKSYFAFKPNMLKPVPPSIDTVTAIRDPFGNSYGYSTMRANAPASTGGYNPTFDLWSVADGAAGTDQSKWIKNW